MKLFIGLDVSLANTAVCVVSEHGQIVKEAETASEGRPAVAGSIIWRNVIPGTG